MVYGEHKGISKSQIAQQIARGSDVGLRLDVQGAATVRKMLTNEASVFECPCARVGGAVWAQIVLGVGKKAPAAAVAATPAHAYDSNAVDYDEGAGEEHPWRLEASVVVKLRLLEKRWR